MEYPNLKNRAVVLLLSTILLLFSCNHSGQNDKISDDTVDKTSTGAITNTQQKQTFMQAERFELPEPGPMIPPVPAIVLGVKGDSIIKDDITIVWTFVLEGTPPYIGISVPDNSAITGEEYVALNSSKNMVNSR